MNVMGAYWARLYPGTESERAIEPSIASLGIPYRTQFPFFLWGVKYFPDFLLPTIGVILEVDDTSHDDPEKQKADAQRTSALNKLGYVVVRCTNEEAEQYPLFTVQRLIVVPGYLGRKGPGLPAPPHKSPRRRRPKGSAIRKRTKAKKEIS